MSDTNAVVKPTRQDEAKKALRRFWLAGTAGAFLSGLSRSFPADFATRSFHPNVPYTLDIVLRYGFMMWFLCYFAISSFSAEREHATKSTLASIVHDLGQSAVSLLAIFYLGFVTRGQPPDPAIKFAYANFAVLVISGLSWMVFQSWTNVLSRISVLRELGIVFSALGITSAWVFADSLHAQSVPAYAWFIALQVGLWATLARYWWIQWNMDDESFENANIFSGTPEKVHEKVAPQVPKPVEPAPVAAAAPQTNGADEKPPAVK